MNVSSAKGEMKDFRNTDTTDKLMKFLRSFAHMCRENSAGALVEVRDGAKIWIDDSFHADEHPDEMTRLNVMAMFVHNPTIEKLDSTPWYVTPLGCVDPSKYDAIALELHDGSVQDLRGGRRYENIAAWVTEVRQCRKQERRRARRAISTATETRSAQADR
jgi:hypothetical protein